jgi:hypothetical protein
MVGVCCACSSWGNGIGRKFSVRGAHQDRRAYLLFISVLLELANKQLTQNKIICFNS